MYNERTFQGWIRTGIGIMAFGFVVEKFSLFTKQMSFILGKSAHEGTLLATNGYSAMLGIILVGLGAFMSALAFIRFKKVENQIDADTWYPSSVLDALLTLSVLTVGILIVIYLIYNH